MDIQASVARLLPARVRLRRNVRRALATGEPEMHLLPALSDPARTSLDIGACRGIYAACLQGISKKVIAFEPQPHLADFIRRALPDVEVKECAVAESELEAVLHIPEDEKDKGQAYLERTELRAVEYSASIKVQSVTVDGLGISDVGFIKIDVEGLELAVLQGASATIARDLPNLLVEAEERHRPAAVESVWSFLKFYGYDGWFVLDGELRSIDEFSLDIHQNTGTRSGQPAGGPGYVNNFIFVQPAGSERLKEAVAQRT